MKKLFPFFCCVLLALVFTQCKDEDPSIDPNPIDNGIEEEVFEYPEAVDDVLPVIMVHGFLASGDTYSLQAKRFIANGYDQDYVHTFDWNSIEQDDPQGKLHALIEDILAETGVDRVNLMGHSAGGGVCYSLLSDSIYSLNVNKYVHLGSTVNEDAAGIDGGISTLNIYSEDDLIVEGGDIFNAENVSIPGLDHYEVATSSLTFESVYQFFHNSEPQYLNPIPTKEITLGGKVLTLGENVPQANIQLNIYAQDAQNGGRVNETPDFSTTTDENGFWDGFTAEPDTPYEFEISNDSDPEFRKIHYYRTGFTSSDQLVYLRAFPGPSSLAGQLLSGIPSDDDQAVIAVFTSNQAVISGRDELSIAGVNLSTEALASADQTTIAFFCYDDGDLQSSESGLGIFGFVPFLNGIDLFFPTVEDSQIPVVFNGKTIYAQNWKSKQDGVSVVVFD